MSRVFKDGPIEIWASLEAWGLEYYVYGVNRCGGPRVCPSLGMAREIAAGNFGD